MERLRQETADFLWVWRFYWEASERMRHELQGAIFPYEHVTRTKPLASRVVRDRVNRVHCHGDARGGFPILPTIIREGGISLRAVCPSWSLPDAPAHDERLSLDDAVAEPLRSGLRAAREQLIEELEQAAASLPDDGWIAGQRVRFAVDQGDSAAIARAMRGCGAQRWWCHALSGYARYAMDDPRGADSLFTASLAVMPMSERCVWSDVAFFLDESARKQYTPMSCEQRDSVADRLWWLADPLYSEPGNERRAEHYARLVMVVLRGDSASGERWNFDEADGGRSLREMLVRYGWPSQAWWSGPLEDRSHYSYLRIFDERVQSLGVFTTAEYTGPRFHTVPEWSAIVDPWHAQSSAWQLIKARDGRVDPEWWPLEHYARRAGPLSQIAEQQTAMLRRGTYVELVVATDLARTELGRAMSRAATVVLAVTPAPDTIRVERKAGFVDSVAVARAFIAARPSIVGLEARANGIGAVARTRFGITPPPPLSEMGAGEIAISEPVLLRAARGGERPVSDPQIAIDAMLGTTRLVGLERVGVYWETYG
ncbi:MAG: hypothetical protein ACREBE_22280, partial [bacterium]